MKYRSIITTKLRKLERDKVPNPTLPALTPYRYSSNILPPRQQTADEQNITEPCDTVIVNLSEITLSSDEEKLLSKGLNFCPATGFFDEFQLLRDLDNFARNLRLREYFLGRPSNSQNTQQRPKNN